MLETYQNKDLLKFLEEWTEQIKSLEANLQYIDSKIQELDYERNFLSLGFFAVVHTFFKTKRHNDFIQDNLRLTRSKSEQLDLAQKTKADIQLLQDKSKKLKLDIEQLAQTEKFLSDYTEFLEARKFDVASFKEDDFWQNYSNDYDEFHRTTPYFNQEVEKLRSKLFIQAIKLHEIFINANASNFWNSLNFFSEIISGKLNNIEPEIWRILWQNFFMVIPVVSTNFHSFDNMFKHFRHNDLAWLIIDEAGQTPPQCAVSAIYKSKNVIVVGDPMQTAPISILGQALITKLML